MPKSYFRRKKFICLAAFGLLFLAGCSSYAPEPEPSQLEIRQFQTRTYDNRKGQTKKIMKAVINVLQDEGYIIRNADRELGFITASKEVDISNNWEVGLSIFSNGNQARYRKNSIVEASVNISEFGREVKVRIIFQNKVLDNLGGTVSVQQIKSPDFYQNFFSKVDKGIFLEKQNI